jgi:CRISPR/Cas system CSM-associated protein Csm2 small subunit
MFKIHYKAMKDMCNRSIIEIEKSLDILKEVISKIDKKDVQEKIIKNLSELHNTIKECINECDKIYDQCKKEHYCNEDQMKSIKHCIKKCNELIQHINETNDACTSESKCKKNIEKLIDICQETISEIDQVIETMEKCKTACIDR